MPTTRLRRYYRNGMMPQLAVFEASVRLGSFTLAARELHLAQPTVSTLIRKLTDAIGEPLFGRTGTRMQVTPAGQALYEGCKEIRCALERVEGRFAELQEQVAPLRLGVGTPAASLAMRLLHGFVESQPGVEVALEMRNFTGLTHRLVTDEDDLYIFATLPKEREVVHQRIVSNPFVVLARADHPLAGERSIAFERFAAEPLLVRERGSATRVAVCECFAAQGAKPRVRMELSTNEAIVQAVQAGLGLSILPRHALTPDGSAGLCALDVVGFPIERSCHFVYPVDRPLCPLARAFMEYVRTNVDTLVEGRGDATALRPHDAVRAQRHRPRADRAQWAAQALR